MVIYQFNLTGWHDMDRHGKKEWQAGAEELHEIKKVDTRRRYINHFFIMHLQYYFCFNIIQIRVKQKEFELHVFVRLPRVSAWMLCGFAHIHMKCETSETTPEFPLLLRSNRFYSRKKPRYLFIVFAAFSGFVGKKTKKYAFPFGCVQELVGAEVMVVLAMAQGNQIQHPCYYQMYHHHQEFYLITVILHSVLPIFWSDCAPSEPTWEFCPPFTMKIKLYQLDNHFEHYN